jgi:hypothetical protein
MDKNATIRSTGKGCVWRLRLNRDAVRDVMTPDLELEALGG